MSILEYGTKIINKILKDYKGTPLIIRLRSKNNPLIYDGINIIETNKEAKIHRENKDIRPFLVSYSLDKENFNLDVKTKIIEFNINGNDLKAIIGVYYKNILVKKYNIEFNNASDLKNINKTNIKRTFELRYQQKINKTRNYFKLLESLFPDKNHYKCDFCDETFKDFTFLTKHIKKTGHENFIFDFLEVKL